MAKKKTEMLNVRLSPPFKRALKAAAEREQRSISNLIAYLITRHCVEVGIPIDSGEPQSMEQKNG